MSTSTTSESYLQTQLRQQALVDAVAAPTEIDDLLDRLAEYLSPDEVGEVRRAYEFAAKSHDGQFRRTGHQYITHPLAVANILTDMRMDHSTIMAAIMHDVIEDTSADKETLSELFSKEVAMIVDGVSKLDTIFDTRAEAQAENFQKMALATAKDLRVVLVKLADRLHNIRTIGVMPRPKRQRIARETLDFYAPIANRLGMHAICTELEDLAFQALYPLRADRIKRAIEDAKGKRSGMMADLHSSLEAALRREGIDASVTSREKNPYSIYRKMKAQRKSFSEIMDVFALRIVVEQVDTCYRALGVVHNLYKPLSGRFKDYIAIPKVNGYQSLHTSLIGTHGVPIEVQIRTRHMDTLAEHGIAGHWLYKSGDDGGSGSHVRARKWIAGLLDLQRLAGDSREFVENLKYDLFPDEVYVFTPQGDIRQLPRGACAIDFAYAVHTDIGNHCVGARINRVAAPVSRPLESGQMVEIITAKDARPSPDWLRFTVSVRARTSILQALKDQRNSDSARLGRRLLDRSLRNADTSIKALDFRRLRKVFKEFNVRKLDDLLVEIGMGNIMAYAVAQRLLAADNPEYEAVDIEEGGPVAIHGSAGLVITYPHCCRPIPGDAIIGHVSPGKGLVIHTETCRNVDALHRNHASELIPARWARSVRGEFETVLLVAVDRHKGVIAELAAVANDAGAGINNIHVNERSAESSTVRLELSVTGKPQLSRLSQRLLALSFVQSVTRASN